MVPTTGPDGKRTLVPGPDYRNAALQGFTRSDLAADVTLEISGTNAMSPPGAGIGNIIGGNVFLGEALTDAAGLPIVVGGRGEAATKNVVTE
jgi:hypothetical protein